MSAIDLRHSEKTYVDDGPQDQRSQHSNDSNQGKRCALKYRLSTLPNGSECRSHCRNHGEIPQHRFSKTFRHECFSMSIPCAQPYILLIYSTALGERKDSCHVTTGKSGLLALMDNILDRMHSLKGLIQFPHWCLLGWLLWTFCMSLS